jgi:hypothetical protein
LTDHQSQKYFDLHRKYETLKLGGGQAYDRSSDYAAVAA